MRRIEPQVRAEGARGRTRDAAQGVDPRDERGRGGRLREGCLTVRVAEAYCPKDLRPELHPPGASVERPAPPGAGLFYSGIGRMRTAGSRRHNLHPSFVPMDR